MGNCWFISALSTLASEDEYIRGGGDLIDPKNLTILDKGSV
jgi:hypothetical protein